MFLRCLTHTHTSSSALGPFLLCQKRSRRPHDESVNQSISDPSISLISSAPCPPGEVSQVEQAGTRSTPTFSFSSPASTKLPSMGARAARALIPSTLVHERSYETVQGDVTNINDLHNA